MQKRGAASCRVTRNVRQVRGDHAVAAAPGRLSAGSEYLSVGVAMPERSLRLLRLRSSSMTDHSLADSPLGTDLN